ncbi:MAG: VOC family protein [Melioribacteraceae bacterium]|nr:VOC family protein [Melioribacteraceae bacterium]MCF8354210.1 VOC family protein [Melioribacteraceae bacterium]MCF8392856.1 VOC family protein [Melioribacteraceae bacterium]MCF8418658.1 VOC family protein [Melioribacteraceae bacterium]
MANVINWFEIPASDFNRAVKFYTEVIGGEFYKEEMMGIKMAFFPMEGEGVGGAICAGEGFTPSSEGTKVYLNGGEDLSNALGKVEKAGGKIIMPKTLIREDIGYMAFFVDTEGNTVALHSMK